MKLCFFTVCNTISCPKGLQSNLLVTVKSDQQEEFKKLSKTSFRYGQLDKGGPLFEWV